MNAGLLLAGLWRTSTLALFARSFLTGLGLIAGIIGLACGLFPDVAKALGWPILIGALGAALVYGTWQAWPRISFSREFECRARRSPWSSGTCSSRTATW